MTSTYLPHRYTSKSVYRFVPALALLQQQHSLKGVAYVRFDPAELHLSMETAIGRLRDAAHALSNGLTTHHLINGAELAEVWPLYRVTSDGQYVVIVSKTAEHPEQAQPVQSTGELAVLNTHNLRFVEAITAFAVLLGQRLLVGEVVILGELSDDLKQSLMAEHDIVIQLVDTNQHKMI